ncbi:MAG: PEP-utilizing enzyme [Desulfotalea sp.]
MSQEDVTPLQSDALKANLLETSGEVEIRNEYLPLLGPVAKYRGLFTSLEKLLYEISHPFRNWSIILPQLKSYVLKNHRHYLIHENGPEAVKKYTDIFFEALEDTKKKPDLMQQVVVALLSWLEKVCKFQPENLSAFQNVLDCVYQNLLTLDKNCPEAMIQLVHGQQTISLIIKNSLKCTDYNFEYLIAFELAILNKTYQCWLDESDPLRWYEDFCSGDYKQNVWKVLNLISHDTMHHNIFGLQEIKGNSDQRYVLEKLLRLPSHIDIVRLYRDVPNLLEPKFKEQVESEVVERPSFRRNKKIVFLFRIMDTAGLHLIHEETLREINRNLVQLVRQQSFEEIEEFLQKTFELLKVNVKTYPHTSLQCIQVLGGEVFDRGNSRMVEAFLWGVVRFGFQHSDVMGVDENWQPLTNPAHLSNIRVWLNLITREPKWCGTLFSALIIHLKLSGTCIKDTDLFQRDITNLLNHPIEPIYNLCKQFAKLMPVFFNEIGSEGELRDVSTELDEIHKRKDVLIHFLRKQGHVESSNLIVGFAQSIFVFWKTKDKECLTPYLPEEVYSQIELNGGYIDEPHMLTKRLWDYAELGQVEDLLDISEDKITSFLILQIDIHPREKRRFELLVTMLKLLNAKYRLSFQALRPELLAASKNGFPEMKALLVTLENNNDNQRKLSALLENLLALKSIILSSEKFEAQEDIYYKRHIAVDIPSVYGRYKERKFDALSLTFRLENLANLYIEKLADSVNLAMITQATFYDIISCLKLYLNALDVDGINSRRLGIYMSLLKNSLKVRRFSYTQYIDIFRGMSEGVKDIIYSFYTNIHQNNLSLIIPQLSKEDVLQKYRALYDQDLSSSVHRISEAFLRELISSTFGLQHLDNFILRVIETLENQNDRLSSEHLDLLMTYNPNRAISSLVEPNQFTNNLIYLGNKGFNLSVLAAENIPIPPAFAITTEVFRCREIVFGYNEARAQFMKKVRAYLAKIEQQTGQTFGSPTNPLLLSVRSGGSISMPGMMATVHNVGLNVKLIEQYVFDHGNEYLTWDNYRRFLQSWAMIKGIDREDFQVLMNAAKEKHSVRLKRDFTPKQMKELALSYHELVLTRGLGIPDDPWLQLVGAIELVLDSWDNEKAIDYRRIMNVSDAWGTAVIIQAMVYGNINSKSGSGVLFTSHPYRKVQRVALWGDYSYGNQGEDIVSGLVTSYAMSVEQAEIDGRSVGNTLENRFPLIYEELLKISRELVYEKRWNPQEIEFTFEGEKADDLYLLQTRDMITIKKKEELYVFDVLEDLEEFYLGKGVGVCGSALSGRAVFTEENISQLRAEDPSATLILIRQDTVPEDIKVIDQAEGLLTSRGGQTSHASVVAVRLEKTCMVGCRKLRVYESKNYCEIKGNRIDFGDYISIDGRSGRLYFGEHEVRAEYHILPI